MAETIGSAYIQIIPSADGLTGSLENVLGGEADKAGVSAGKKFSSGLGSGIKAAAGVTAVAAGAAMAAVTGVVKGAMDTAKIGDEIDKQSQKLGVTAEQYQTLSFAAEHSGFSMSALQTAAKKLASTDFEGNVVDALDTIMALGDETERTAMAQELFGTKVAQEMAPLLNGSQTVAEFRDQLAELGGIMSDESVANSAAFEDALTNMQTAMKGMTNGLMADFLPSITQVVDGIAAVVSGDSGGLEMLSQGFQAFMDQLGAMIPGLLDTGTEMVLMLVNGIVANLPQLITMGIDVITKLILGIANALPTLVAKAPEIIAALVSGIVAAAPKLLEAAKTLLTTLANAVKTYAPMLLEKGRELVTQLKAAIVGKVSSLVEAGKDLVRGIWDGINGNLAWIKDKITGWVGSVTDFLKKLFGIHSPSTVMRDEVGRFIPEGIAEGILNNAGAVDDAMSTLDSHVQQSAINAAVSASVMSTGVLAGNSGASGGVYGLLAEYLPQIARGGNVNVTLSPDVDRLFKSFVERGKTYRSMTGKEAY